MIGGDDQYRGEDEEERAVISRWARRKVASQFNEECLDGRRSFIFSWNKQHREIHEEALLHYFDPRKKGKKFEYQPKPKPVPLPEPKIIPAPDVDSDEEVGLPVAIIDNFVLMIMVVNGKSCKEWAQNYANRKRNGCQLFNQIFCQSVSQPVRSQWTSKSFRQSLSQSVSHDQSVSQLVL